MNSLKDLFKRSIFGVVLALAAVSHANEGGGESAHRGSECDELLNQTGKKSVARRKSSGRQATQEAASNGQRTYTLRSFFAGEAENIAIRHPFVLANAAEKVYSMLTAAPAREAVDPLYRVKKVMVHPMLAGEHPAAGGRMVVGQEESIHTFIQFLGSIARGDRSGKAIGFPGPAGTGKTELLYVEANIEQNLGKIDQYKQFSYRFKNLDQIPFLRNMYRFDKEGTPNLRFIDPNMPRSPFTLLREDMQDEILAETLPKIRAKWNMTISKGWKKPEPKTRDILRAIFEYERPEIAEGSLMVEDLSREEYLQILEKYVVIVPKALLKPKSEAQIIRAQTDDPNWQALFAAPNLSRMPFYQNSALGVDYNGLIFQQDGGLLMMDELYRNPPALLNVFLEIVQNRIAQTDFGEPVELDVVPVWNANDESIELAMQDQALKASLDRTERNPMRLLLPPNQIEAVSLFQVDIDRFNMRKLDSTEVVPLEYSLVYGTPDQTGQTNSAYGRYALYYKAAGQDILIAPLALNYMAWLASASRFVVDQNKLREHKNELNLISANPSLFTNPITRLRIALGDQTVEMAERMELSRLKDLLHEGENGISSRDVETWLKAALNMAVEQGKTVVTPRMIDHAFGEALDRGKIQPPRGEVRAYWQLLRKQVKMELLLPRLEKDVKSILSGDGERAERVYDEVEREMIEISSNPDAREVIPDDGSQSMAINHARLKEIREIYREKFGRDFNPNFLLKNLRAAQRGEHVRDGQLLEAIRLFLARHDSMTADYISAFNDLYHGKNNDPAVVEKAGQVESLLARYGYDPASFRDAVMLVSQLRNERLKQVQSGR